MADSSDSESQACLLVYDGECRLCVTAKKGLERLETHADAAAIRMVAYQSEEAKQALGKGYRPGRPDVAFLVGPKGEIASGLDAFLILLSIVLVCGPVPVLCLWQSSACGGFRGSR
jgi:predicted DCC family thiol-disulfide oxidoreductase YuxK